MLLTACCGLSRATRTLFVEWDVAVESFKTGFFSIPWQPQTNKYLFTTGVVAKMWRPISQNLGKQNRSAWSHHERKLRKLLFGGWIDPLRLIYWHVDTQLWCQMQPLTLLWWELLASAFCWTECGLLWKRVRERERKSSQDLRIVRKHLWNPARGCSEVKVWYWSEQSLKKHQKFQGLCVGKFKFIQHTSHEQARQEAQVFL